MMDEQRTSLGATFDQVASEYDAVRPGYPEALVRRVLDAVPETASVLEIGVGTGIATEAFAACGFSIQCVEPGAELIEKARARLHAYPRVTFVHARFEDAALPQASFDLVFAAQSYHWLDPEVRLKKIATLLRPNGVVAVFGNAQVPGTEPLDGALRGAWEQHAPHLVDFNAAYESYVASSSGLLREIERNSHFATPLHEVFPWQVTTSAGEYGKLLSTYSHFRRLDAATRQRLRDACERVVQDHGGHIQLQYRSGLFLVQLKPFLGTTTSV
jgi:SAM-dependent methyltransferase